MTPTVDSDLLQLDVVPRKRAGGCHGWPLREHKLELWWTKMCGVSSYVAYETRGDRFAHIRRRRRAVEGW
jgi:hypothetical protein